MPGASVALLLNEALLSGMYSETCSTIHKMCAGLPQTFSLIYFSSGRVTTWQPYTFLHIKREKEKLTKTMLLSLRISASFLSFTCCTQRHKENVKILWTQHFKFSNEIAFCTCRLQKFSWHRGGWHYELCSYLPKTHNDLIQQVFVVITTAYLSKYIIIACISETGSIILECTNKITYNGHNFPIFVK